MAYVDAVIERYGERKRRTRTWCDTSSPEDRRRARQIVRTEIRAGRMVRPDTCSYCDKGGRKIHAHHEDYTQPLLVEWLCTKCHGTRHSMMVQATRFMMRLIDGPELGEAANG